MSYEESCLEYLSLPEFGVTASSGLAVVLIAQLCCDKNRFLLVTPTSIGVPAGGAAPKMERAIKVCSISYDYLKRKMTHFYS